MPHTFPGIVCIVERSICFGLRARGMVLQSVALPNSRAILLRRRKKRGNFFGSKFQRPARRPHFHTGARAVFGKGESKKQCAGSAMRRKTSTRCYRSASFYSAIPETVHQKQNKSKSYPLCLPRQSPILIPLAPSLPASSPSQCPTLPLPPKNSGVIFGRQAPPMWVSTGFSYPP